jgi:hypothetical protein
MVKDLSRSRMSAGAMLEHRHGATELVGLAGLKTKPAHLIATRIALS